jgi:hypothetical protein
MSSLKRELHVQEILLPKNMFAYPLKLILNFFEIFCISNYNKNIHTQLCINVKTHHHHTNYLKLDYSIFLT